MRGSLWHLTNVQSRLLLVGVPAYGQITAAPTSDMLLRLLIAAAKQGQKGAGTLQQKGSAPAPKTSEDKAESKREADTINFAASEFLKGYKGLCHLPVSENFGSEGRGLGLVSCSIRIQRWLLYLGKNP